MNFWMRWLDFRALRDLLLLVGRHPLGLRASELERLATDERILLRRDGRPYARSIHYHHRRSLERLGLLERRGRRFALNDRSLETNALTAQTTFREKLEPPQKEAFANAVLRNEDCQDVFFGSFLRSPASAHNVATFVERAQPVELLTRSGGIDQDKSHPGSHRPSNVRFHSKHVAIRPAGATPWRLLEGANAVQAVHFGLRAWCVDQLGFLDATCAADGTYTLYPKHIVPQVTDQELAAEMLEAIDFDGEWATIRIPDYALATGIRRYVSVDHAKGVLMDWLTDHPDLVAGIPTRVGFITDGLTDRQHALALKGYLRSHSGAYLSHIRIHRMLRERVQNGVSGP